MHMITVFPPLHALIRPPYLPRNFGHIRKVALPEMGEVNSVIVVVTKNSPH